VTRPVRFELGAQGLVFRNQSAIDVSSCIELGLYCYLVSHNHSAQTNMSA
jgi:hypothetical protein